LKEIERLNIPVVQICTMIPVAKEWARFERWRPALSSARQVIRVTAENEREFRRELVLPALQILQEDVNE
jgi:hypothetical protein